MTPLIAQRMNPKAELEDSFTSETPTKTTKKTKKLTNGAILIVSKVLKLVMSSAAEADTGEVFINAKERAVLRTTLEELEHKQPPTPMETENTSATVNINGTTRQKCTKAMDM
jgi:hypothetical protein